jgi:hypothetical protein
MEQSIIKSSEDERLNLSQRTGFFLTLKQLGIRQHSAHAYSTEKGATVSNNENLFDALPNDISLFSDTELYYIIKDYKKKYEKCIEVIKRFDAGIIGMYEL